MLDRRLTGASRKTRDTWYRRRCQRRREKHKECGVGVEDDHGASVCRTE